MTCGVSRSWCERQRSRICLGRRCSRACLRAPRLVCGFNEHIEADGPAVFQQAWKMGLEGIVSKRKDSRYISGRSLNWIKSKNPNAPAVKREAEIDWGRVAP